MSLKIFNTLSKTKEPFIPLVDKQVGIYVCGITLYDDIHIGHLRNIVVFDLLRNYLEHQGYQVNFVRNITDIDDKIIAKAKKENKSPLNLVNHHINNFHQLLDKMQIRTDYIEPRVTEYLPAITNYIQKLIDTNYAYESQGSVYFTVPDEDMVYPLSRKKLKDLQEHTRLDENSDKKNKSDFALWKKDLEFGFPSPWGVGRPGWHIECSVMHHHTLGQQFDIHGGGRDLIFPHHENEIVQSHAHNHKVPAKYWMHNGMMTITVTDEQGKKIEQKISKSLGNSIYVKDLIDTYSPETLKYFTLKAHYRNNQDFNAKELKNSEGFILKFESLVYFSFKNQNKNNESISSFTTEEFFEALNDDLNTPKALAFINQKLSSISQKPQKNSLEQILSLLKILGVYPSSINLDNIFKKHLVQQQTLIQQFAGLLTERNQFKLNQNWAEADKVRIALNAQGLQIMDLPEEQYFLTLDKTFAQNHNKAKLNLKP